MKLPKETIEDDASLTLITTMLEGRCSPELLDVYSAILKTLNDCNFGGHHEEIDMLFALLNNMDIGTEDITESVDEILRTAVDRCLLAIGITIADNTPIAILAEMADILLNYDTTDTPEIIANAIEASEDDIEALCKVLEYKGTRDADDWFLYIEDVTPNTIKRMKQLALSETVERDESGKTQLSEELSRRLSRLVTQKSDTIAAELANQNIAVGASLESLYGLNVGRLIDMPIEKAVDELMALSVVSNESFSTAQAGVSTWLDDLCRDIDERRRAEQTRISLESVYRPIFGDFDE